MAIARTVPWNGSKRWMEKPLQEVFSRWDGQGRFFDPFCGSGFVSALVREMHSAAPQVIGDVNPWLIGFLRRQIEGSPSDPVPEPGLSDIEHWRRMTSTDGLTTNEQAARFLICLLTSWGARYQDSPDGAFVLPIQTESGRYNQAVGTLPEIWRTFWLNSLDTVQVGTWQETLVTASPGDLVFLDPPYTETMGYGVEWTVGDQIDVLLWVEQAVQRGVHVIATNHEALGRHYSRCGLPVKYLKSPSRGRTSKQRREMLAVSPGLVSAAITDLFGV